MSTAKISALCNARTTIARARRARHAVLHRYIGLLDIGNRGRRDRRRSRRHRRVGDVVGRSQAQRRARHRHRRRRGEMSLRRRGARFDLCLDHASRISATPHRRLPQGIDVISRSRRRFRRLLKRLKPVAHDALASSPATTTRLYRPARIAAAAAIDAVAEANSHAGLHHPRPLRHAIRNLPPRHQRMGGGRQGEAARGHRRRTRNAPPRSSGSRRQELRQARDPIAHTPPYYSSASFLRCRRRACSSGSV